MNNRKGQTKAKASKAAQMKICKCILLLSVALDVNCSSMMIVRHWQPVSSVTEGQPVPEILQNYIPGSKEVGVKEKEFCLFHALGIYKINLTI